MLIVTDRARAPYRKVMVAVDQSAASRRAVETAVGLFPDARRLVFHAYDVPYTSLMGDPSAHRDNWRQMALTEVQAFLRTAGFGDQDRGGPEVVLGEGPPERLLLDLVPRLGIELVVLGSHGRGAVAHVLLGSVAKRIVSLLPCDALVVR